MPRLPHDGVDDVEPGDLELRAALLDELLDGLDDVLVELDGLDRRFRDARHPRLRDGRLQLVERRQLIVERLHRLHLESCVSLLPIHNSSLFQMSRLCGIPGRSRFFAVIFRNFSQTFC